MQGADVQSKLSKPENSEENYDVAQERVLSRSKVPNTSCHSGTRRKRPPIRDPQEYVNAVFAYSRLSVANSLYPGQYLQVLVRFLWRHSEPYVPNILATEKKQQWRRDFKFVSIHNLDPTGGRSIKHFESISDFESEASSLLANPGFGHLLYMRGYPSPEWVLSIGTSYQIDPEFFQSHLDFRQGQQNYFLSPPLPSSSARTIKLRVTTIGETQLGAPTGSSQEKLESLRTQNEKALNAYVERTRGGYELGLGDPIVRQCSLHDLQHFSIEQDITIHVARKGSSWVVYIWLDNGHDLDHNLMSWLTSPLSTPPWKTRFLPVVQNRPYVSLRPPSRLKLHQHDCETRDGKIFQSASLLHLDDGLFLDAEIAAIDSFYAAQGPILFAAASENQFLNMIEAKLRQELDARGLIQQRNPTLSNLLYTQQILDRHVQQIRENIASIQGRDRGEWPRGSLNTNKQNKADQAVAKIDRNFEHLLARAQILHEQCSRGVQIVMNNANVKEAREAMSQSEIVAKLTRLAFIFVPLSFTSGFFGMNFAQFGSGKLDLWVWFAVTIPVLTLALLFMYYDIPVLARKIVSCPIS
ncbi:MAG: hypothetical protein Q9157_002856 [Trypethelium eluteriae]